MNLVEYDTLNLHLPRVIGTEGNLALPWSSTVGIRTLGPMGRLLRARELSRSVC